MRFKLASFIRLFVLLYIIASCHSVEVTYLQDIDEVNNLSDTKKIQKNTTKIKTGDELVIMVSAEDRDVVKPFNQNYSSGEIIRNTVNSGNVQPTVDSTPAPTYIVDSNGNIDFPTLGNIKASGLTTEGLKDNLHKILSRYIREPLVSVRLRNFKVSVLGEVKQPGEYTLYEGNGTVLRAIALAGDLTMYGKREDVLLLRKEGNGDLRKTRLDLTKSDFLFSPYYNLQQGDIIYISPNKVQQKNAKRDPNLGIYVSLATVLISVLTLLRIK
ncbi:MAG: polysaccharide export protein [Bergeyella sp.]|nr:polysaccharide export protein [Bergeyella sp.]